MKKVFIIIFFALLGINEILAQLDNTELLFHWKEDTLVGSSAFNNTYNEIWGVAQNGEEYAIIGSTAGTHIFDVSDPANAYEAAFIPGAYQGVNVIHRDYHDYKGYLYAVCDEGYTVSTLQIIDLQSLPESAETVYDSQELFRTSHNIFIDTASAILYACTPGGTDAKLMLYSLEDPTNPQEVLEYNGINVGHVHDLYVQNDTAYLNCGNNGLYVVDFSDVENPIVIGSLTDYQAFGQGYNHSGWLDEGGDYYYMADETWGTDMKVVELNDFQDVKITNLCEPPTDSPNSIVHNQLVYKNYLFAAYYYDGLQIYDISDPYNPERVRAFSTSQLSHSATYEGAWGVYPFLPSGNILVADMQEGLFVIDVNLDLELQGCTDENACNYDINAVADDGSCAENDCAGICGGDAVAGTSCDDGNADTTGEVWTDACTCEVVNTGVENTAFSSLKVYPIPTQDFVVLENLSNEKTTIHLYHSNGQKVREQVVENIPNVFKLDLSDVATGIYFLEIQQAGEIMRQKLVKE